MTTSALTPTDTAPTPPVPDKPNISDRSWIATQTIGTSTQRTTQLTQTSTTLSTDHSTSGRTVASSVPRHEGPRRDCPTGRVLHFNGAKSVFRCWPGGAACGFDRHERPAAGFMRQNWVVDLRAARLLVFGVLVVIGSLAPSRGRPVTEAPVTWLIFVDDLHINLRDTGLVRKLLTSIATDLIRDGDSFAVRSSGPSDLSITLSSNRALLDAAIPKVSYVGLELTDVVGPETNDEVRYRAEFAGTAAVEMLNALPRGTIGRAAMLYISNGYFLIPADATVAGLLRMAQRSAITVFALSPRGLRRAPQVTSSGGPALSARYCDDAMLNSLRAIAEATGGFAIEEADFADTLQRIARAMR
jgi:hypothetical protein